MDHPMCAGCGHQKAKHVESILKGHIMCVSRGCECSLFELPKDGGGPSKESAKTTHEIYQMIREAGEAGLEAAESQFPTPQDALHTLNGKTPIKDDPVNHPAHYTAYPGIEIIQLTRRMSFNRGNAVKYVARAGLKNKDTEVQDLEKAIWYLQDEVKLLKGEYEDNG